VGSTVVSGSPWHGMYATHLIVRQTLADARRSKIPFTAIQFPLYEKLKSLLSIHYLPNQRKPLPHEAALCGSLAGGFAGGISTPLDVVKTRVMLEAKVGPLPRFYVSSSLRVQSAHPSPTDPASSGSALSIPSRMRRIAQEEGVKTLFRGGMARTTWISLGGAIFLGAYETVMSVIRKDETE
jgi:solute carrier family 25 S-adenosylmethionine transporter 26